MVVLREPQFIVATGRKAVGKTYTTIQMIMRYIQSNPATGKKGRKVLIYDTNKEYTQFKTIAIQDVKRFAQSENIEVRRILPVTSDGKEMNLDQMVNLLYAILEDFRCGLIVLEDINRYLIDTRTSEIIGTLATNRHRDLDIICHLQSLAPMTTRMWQNCSVVRFHYQIDNINRYKIRIPNYELFKIAQCLVNTKYHAGNSRFYCFVYSEENRIKGAFTKKEFTIAALDYLTENPTMIRNAQLRFGGGNQARERALNYLVNDLFKYYGGIAA